MSLHYWAIPLEDRKTREQLLTAKTFPGEGGGGEGGGGREEEGKEGNGGSAGLLEPGKERRRKNVSGFLFFFFSCSFRDRFLADFGETQSERAACLGSSFLIFFLCLLLILFFY